MNPSETERLSLEEAEAEDLTVVATRKPFAAVLKEAPKLEGVGGFVLCGPVTSGASFQTCRRVAYRQHIVDYEGCDCLRMNRYEPGNEGGE